MAWPATHGAPSRSWQQRRLPQCSRCSRSRSRTLATATWSCTAPRGTPTRAPCSTAVTLLARQPLTSSACACRGFSANLRVSDPELASLRAQLREGELQLQARLRLASTPDGILEISASQISLVDPALASPTASNGTSEWASLSVSSLSLAKHVAACWRAAGSLSAAGSNAAVRRICNRQPNVHPPSSVISLAAAGVLGGFACVARAHARSCAQAGTCTANASMLKLYLRKMMCAAAARRQVTALGARLGLLTSERAPDISLRSPASCRR